MQAPRSRPIPQMRFTQPPPNYSSGLGFGGSSGPGCGGGDFWDELAKFGIFPNSNSALGTSTSARSFNYPTSSNGRQSPTPNTAFGSPPISSPSFLSGNTTSMLPTPHSPSPLLQNRVASTHFAFPPIWSGASQGQQNGNNSQAYRRSEPWRKYFFLFLTASCDLAVLILYTKNCATSQFLYDFKRKNIVFFCPLELTSKSLKFNLLYKMLYLCNLKTHPPDFDPPFCIPYIITYISVYVLI